MAHMSLRLCVSVRDSRKLLCLHCMEKKFHFCAGGSEVNVFPAAPDSNCQVNDYVRIYIYTYLYIHIRIHYICNICMYDMYYCVCIIRTLVRVMLNGFRAVPSKAPWKSRRVHFGKSKKVEEIMKYGYRPKLVPNNQISVGCY